MKKTLVFQKVQIHFQNMDDIIIKDASFKIVSGMTVALIGPSGIGKTTLLNALFKGNFLLKGQILYNDQNVKKLKPKDTKAFLNKVTLLNQQPNLILEDTVYNNVKRSINTYKNTIYKLFGILTKSQREEIYRSLEKLDILSKSHSVTNELSGGQQQRVEIAKTMITKPEVILADEPTSSLDIQTAEKIVQQLLFLADENQAILLVSLHDINLVKKYFQYYISIKEGLATLAPISKLTKAEIARIYNYDKN